MKITQELLKKSIIYRSQYLLDRCLDLSSLRDLDYSQQRFYSKTLFVYGFCIILIRLGKLKVCDLHNPYWTRKVQGLCKPIWNRRAH